MSRTFRKAGFEAQLKHKPALRTKAYWQLHGDAWHYEYDHSYWYQRPLRQMVERSLKARNQRELIRYLKDPFNYEVMCVKKLRMRYFWHPEW